MFQIRSQKRIKSYMWIILCTSEPDNTAEQRIKQAVKTACNYKTEFKKEIIMKPNHILAGTLKTLALISAIALTVSSANARSLKS